MKLLLLSDMHLLWHNPVCRLDNLVEEQFNKLGFVLDYAEKNGLTICQSGDFFNSPRSYYLLERVIELLKRYDLEIWAVFGGKRHDTYLYSNETRAATNLGILERSGLVRILGKDPVTTQIDVDMYGVSYGEDIPVVEDEDTFNILVIHAPISDDPKTGEIDADDFLLGHKDYDLILCGDIHRNFALKFENKNSKRFIINTGPMLRKTADLYNFDHAPCFAVFDTDSRGFEWVEIPHKLAGEVISRDHIDVKEDKRLLLDEFTDAINTELDFTIDLVENMRVFMIENKGDLGGDTINILIELINRKEGVE